MSRVKHMHRVGQTTSSLERYLVFKKKIRHTGTHFVTFSTLKRKPTYWIIDADNPASVPQVNLSNAYMYNWYTTFKYDIRYTKESLWWVDAYLLYRLEEVIDYSAGLLHCIYRMCQQHRPTSQKVYWLLHSTRVIAMQLARILHDSPPLMADLSKLSRVEWRSEQHLTRPTTSQSVLTNDRRKEARWQMQAVHRRLP